MNLTELFNTRIFRIPDYQRDYVWEEKQLLELWDDLDKIQTVGEGFKKHYTGTIFLEETIPMEAEKWLHGVKFYNVVDGQQRLTTICILLFEMIKGTENGFKEKTKDKILKTFICKPNSSGNSKIYKFCYNPKGNNYNFLLHAIFEDTNVVLNQEHLNPCTRNLANAKAFFQERINKLDILQKKLLLKKITTSLLFDISTIEKDLDVQVVFKTKNNRGKPF